MSIKKGTMFKFDEKILLDWIKNNEPYTALDVNNIVNKSYGINSESKVILSKYVNELAKKSLEYKKKNNIMYAMFDICLALHTLKIVKKKTNNEDHKKRVVNVINNSIKILQGV